MEKNGVIFVFYTMNEGTGKKYTFPKLPASWHWTGSGSTAPVNSNDVMEYENESQFNGDEKDKQKVKDRLAKFFDKLKKEEIVKKYKIRFSYKP